jgi:hypothetical protein
VRLTKASALALLVCAACGSSSGTKETVAPDAGKAVSDASSAKKDGGSTTSRDAGHDAAVATEASVDGGSSDAGGEAAVCPPLMTYGGGETTLHEGSVVANLVDENDAPVAAGQPLYICGINICANPGMTTATGGASLTTNLSMKKPAFKFGDSLTYAEFGIPLTASATDFTMMGTGKIGTGKLSDKPGAALTAGTSATSGDVTVTMPAGSTVSVDELVYSTPDMQMFRSVNVPLTNAALILPSTPAGFALLYGVAPTETTFCPAAQVSVAIPASLGWQPGAAVEFWITTMDTGQTYAPYAGWALASEGAVSADGKTVTTTAGQGFLDLENFAVRLKD